VSFLTVTLNPDPAHGTRPGIGATADRDAAAAALGEHFAHGRLTLDEFNARLDATLTATTHGELSQAAQDLPDPTVFPAGSAFPGRSGSVTESPNRFGEGWRGKGKCIGGSRVALRSRRK
jgi:hypothetical protein